MCSKLYEHPLTLSSIRMMKAIRLEPERYGAEIDSLRQFEKFVLAVEGELLFDGSYLPAGDYEARIFYNDSYELATSQAFAVQ